MWSICLYKSEGVSKQVKCWLTGPWNVVWSTESTMVRIMAWCFSEYLNQYWPIINSSQSHSPDGNFTRDAQNKANLRDLIAATGLVILLKLDSNRRFFLSRVTSNFDRWPWKTIEHLFYTISSFVHHFLPFGEFKLELQSVNAKFPAIWVKIDNLF